MCPCLVETRSVNSEIRRRKRKEEETTVGNYKPFDIAMPCGLITGRVALTNMYLVLLVYATETDSQLKSHQHVTLLSPIVHTEANTMLCEFQT